jgi:YegS/Rv2252/BmrU family lipid kinase
MEETVVLIANPAAKRSFPRKVEKAVRLLRSAGREVRLHLTERRGDAEDYARKASGCGASLVIAAGGDGTFNEVINGLAMTDTKMAILPMGTTNVLAKELGIPEEVETAVKVALAGKHHSVSLGVITFTHRPEASSRYFCLMAGTGFDGEAVYAVNPSLKKCSGKGAYILSGLKTLMRYSPETLTFTVDGKTINGYSAIIGKSSRYGGDFKITPDAQLTSPELYAFIMHGRRRADLLRYALGIMTGKHLGFKDVTYLKAHSVRVEGNARVQIDGDYAGTTPADIVVVPDALKLVY